MCVLSRCSCGGVRCGGGECQCPLECCRWWERWGWLCIREDGDVVGVQMVRYVRELLAHALSEHEFQGRDVSCHFDGVFGAVGVVQGKETWLSLHVCVCLCADVCDDTTDVVLGVEAETFWCTAWHDGCPEYFVVVVEDSGDLCNATFGVFAVDHLEVVLKPAGLVPGGVFLFTFKVRIGREVGDGGGSCEIFVVGQCWEVAVVAAVACCDAASCCDEVVCVYIFQKSLHTGTVSAGRADADAVVHEVVVACCILVLFDAILAVFAGVGGSKRAWELC